MTEFINWDNISSLWRLTSLDLQGFDFLNIYNRQFFEVAIRLIRDGSRVKVYFPSPLSFLCLRDSLPKLSPTTVAVASDASSSLDSSSIQHYYYYYNSPASHGGLLGKQFLCFQYINRKFEPFYPCLSLSHFSFSCSSSSLPPFSTFKPDS